MRSSVSSPASSCGSRSRSFACRASAAASTSTRLLSRDDDAHRRRRGSRHRPARCGRLRPRPGRPARPGPASRAGCGDRAGPHGDAQLDELVDVTHRPVDEDRRRAPRLRLHRDQAADHRHRSRLGDREDEHVAGLQPLERPVRGEVVSRSAKAVRAGPAAREPGTTRTNEPASRPRRPRLERRRDAELGEPGLGRHVRYQSPTLPSA